MSVQSARYTPSQSRQSLDPKNKSQVRLGEGPFEPWDLPEDHWSFPTPLLEVMEYVMTRNDQLFADYISVIRDDPRQHSLRPAELTGHGIQYMHIALKRIDHDKRHHGMLNPLTYTYRG